MPECTLPFMDDLHSRTKLTLAQRSSLALASAIAFYLASQCLCRLLLSLDIYSPKWIHSLDIHWHARACFVLLILYARFTLLIFLRFLYIFGAEVRPHSRPWRVEPIVYWLPCTFHSRGCLPRFPRLSLHDFRQRRSSGFTDIRLRLTAAWHHTKIFARFPVYALRFSPSLTLY